MVERSKLGGGPGEGTCVDRGDETGGGWGSRISQLGTGIGKVNELGWVK